MIEILIFILVIWFIFSKVAKDESGNNVKQVVNEKIKMVKRSENKLDEINTMIEDTKAEIIKASRKEELEDLKFYTELLELLLEEREEMFDNISYGNTAVKKGKKVGRKVKGVINGIREGLKE